MTRRIILTVPPTTLTTIIFPFDHTEKSFDSGFYTPGLTDGRTSMEEITNILKEVATTRNTISTKIWPTSFCFLITFLGSIAAFTCSMIAWSDVMVDFIALSIISFLAVLIAIFVLFLVQISKITNEVKAECKMVAEKHNQIFASRGLRWNIPRDFPTWIELCKDYRTGNRNNNQGIYVPPTQQIF